MPLSQLIWIKYSESGYFSVSNHSGDVMSYDVMSGGLKGCNVMQLRLNHREGLASSINILASAVMFYNEQ